MAEIRFDLLQPVDTGAQVQQGFATGMAMVKEIQKRNALGAYLKNPDDPNAYGALAYLDPQTAADAQRQHLLQRKDLLDQQDRERAAALGDLASRDPAGAREEALRAGDFDLAKTFGDLDAEQQKKTADFWSKAGPVAFRLKQTADPQARMALWQQARPILEAEGAPPHLLDNFDPTNDTQLEAAITTAQTVSQLIDQSKITWHQQGEQPSFATDFMGRPIGTKNPYGAGGGNGGGTPAPSPGAGNGAPRGLRNNNPLNLTKSDFTQSQPGFAGTDSGGRYARFDSPEAGMAAAQRLLGSYIQRGFDTPAKIIERWAPASENGATATANYIAYVSRRAGLAPDQALTPDKIPDVMAAMSEFENGGRAGGQRRVAATGGAPHVASKADYDKLPNGTPYIAPDGSRRVKS